MNYTSYSPVTSNGVFDLVPNTEPAKIMTPLYVEIFTLLKSKPSGMTVSEVLAKVRNTKHSSRVRLALEALSLKGVVVKKEDNHCLRYCATTK